MSGTQTHGFDVVYGISLASFQRAMENLFVNDLPLRLAHVDIAFPLPGAVLGSVTQTGFFSLPDRPSVFLTRTGANSFTLALTYTRSTLSLNPVPGSLSSPLGVAGLGGLAPSDAGETALTIPLTITTVTSGAHSPVTLALASSPPTLLSQPSKLGTLPIAVPAVGAVTLANMQASVLAGVQAGVIGAVRSMLPIIKDVVLPQTAVCNLFPRRLAMKFLNGDAGHAESFAVMVTAADRTGNLNAMTTSLLPAGNEGVLVIANALVRDLICCLLPESPEIVGLAGVEPVTSDANCCRWENVPNINIGGQSFASARRFEVCIVDGGISVSGTVRQEGFGWHADADFFFSVALHRQGDSLVPVSTVVDIDVDIDIEWWAYLVLAVGAVVGIVIGAFTGGTGTIIIGGIIGALAGGLILLLLYGVAKFLTSGVSGALGALAGELGKLQLLPADITDLFGTLDLVGDLIVDDMSVRGHVVLPNSHPVRAESDDQVIREGEAIDLDRGIVQPLGTRFDPDFDLSWKSNPVVAGDNLLARRAGGAVRLKVDLDSTVFNFPADINSRGSSRVVRLHARSFFGLTENDLVELVYPIIQGGVPNHLLPRTNAANPTNAVVFATRTSEGRYAKCAAWQDLLGRLHLRYVTFDTPTPIRLTATWTSARGDVISTPLFIQYKVARTGRLRAELSTLHTPASYRWSWNGLPINGTGTLPGTTAQFTVAGALCTIRTQMGEPLAGEVCVTGSDPTFFEATACRQLNLSGTERESTITVGPGELGVLARLGTPAPTPVDALTLPSTLDAASATFDAQFVSALSVGMKVSESKIKLR